MDKEVAKCIERLHHAGLDTKRYGGMRNTTFHVRSKLILADFFKDGTIIEELSVILMSKMASPRNF